MKSRDTITPRDSIEPRTIDALIAEYWMDFRRVRVPKDINGENEGETLLPPTLSENEFTYPNRGKVALSHFCPLYSTDAIASKLLRNNLSERGYIITVRQWAGRQGFNVELDHPNEKGGDAYAETEEMAICLAVLNIRGLWKHEEWRFDETGTKILVGGGLVATQDNRLK